MQGLEILAPYLKFSFCISRNEDGIFQKKSFTQLNYNRYERTRTNIFLLKQTLQMELADGLEPPAYYLQGSRSTN